MTKRDYYEILEVSRNADETEIKKAYRKKALQYHPDKNPGNKESEEHFKEAAEAYEVLSDPDKRSRYDRFGHDGLRGNFGSSGFSGGMSMDDIFRNFGDIFGDAFGGAFSDFFGGGNNNGRGRAVKKGTNLRIKVKLTLEEISIGVEKKVKVGKYVACNTCSGTGAKGGHAHETCPTCKGNGRVTRVTNTFLGQMQSTSTCPHCGGEGTVIKDKCPDCAGNGIIKGEEIIAIKIPPGVEEGMQLSLNGKGNAAARGGIPGDLLIQVEEIPHPQLIRDGNDLVYEHLISFPEAALGTSIEVPTVEGKAKVKLEPGLMSGKVVKLKGKGLPALQSYSRGDLLIHIHIWTPKNLSKEEKAHLEKMKDSLNFQPDPSQKEKGFFRRMKGIFE
ncbi:MAG: molecular chaperone DnaJ [Bacteroidetes bacterium]|nr:molecular chaperone DnaJ [Bacteroidota bacterium]